MNLQDISDLLDSKLEPIIIRLDALEKKVDNLQHDITNVLKFVSVGNEDLVKHLPKRKLQKVKH